MVTKYAGWKQKKTIRLSLLIIRTLFHPRSVKFNSDFVVLGACLFPSRIIDTYTYCFLKCPAQRSKWCPWERMSRPPGALYAQIKLCLHGPLKIATITDSRSFLRSPAGGDIHHCSRSSLSFVWPMAHKLENPNPNLLSCPVSLFLSRAWSKDLRSTVGRYVLIPANRCSFAS